MECAKPDEFETHKLCRSVRISPPTWALSCSVLYFYTTFPLPCQTPSLSRIRMRPCKGMQRHPHEPEHGPHRWTWAWCQVMNLHNKVERCKEKRTVSRVLDLLLFFSQNRSYSRFACPCYMCFILYIISWVVLCLLLVPVWK